MKKSDTATFLQLMNEQNARIAAMEREKAVQVSPDEIRLQREAERREKWGELRAREHPSHRPRRTNNVFPYVNLNTPD